MCRCLQQLPDTSRVKDLKNIYLRRLRVHERLNKKSVPEPPIFDGAMVSCFQKLSHAVKAVAQELELNEDVDVFEEFEDLLLLQDLDDAFDGNQNLLVEAAVW